MKGRAGILILSALALSLVAVSGTSTITDSGDCTIGFESGAWNESCGDAVISRSLLGSPAGKVRVVRAGSWYFMPLAKEGGYVLDINAHYRSWYSEARYIITTEAEGINFWFSSTSSCNDCNLGLGGNMYFYVDDQLQPGWGGKVFCGQPCDRGYLEPGPEDWAPWQEYSVTNLPEGQHTFKWL